MTVPIPYIIALLALAWISHVFAKMFRREVEPTRRRDLALAGADGPKVVELRNSGSVMVAVRIVVCLAVIGLCLVGIALNALSKGNPLPHHLVEVMLATLGLLCAVPMSHGIIAMLSAKACGLNLPLSVYAMAFGFMFPTSIALLVIALEKTDIDIVQSFLIVYLSVIFPYHAQNRYLKAYPYTE